MMLVPVCLNALVFLAAKLHAVVACPSQKLDEFDNEEATLSHFASLPVQLNVPFHRPPHLHTSPDVILKLNQRFEHYFARNDSITRAQWWRGLPRMREKIEMTALIQLLYEFPNFNDASAASALLRRLHKLSKFVTLSFAQGGCYVVVHEKLPFPRYWGYIVIAAPECITRPFLHHSAAHFESDGDVCNQAAALFERTGSRTLVVAGASRFAVRGGYRSQCQSTNFIADAAHNDETMFQTMLLAVWEAAKRARHLQPASSPPQPKPTFLQWHGMGNRTCPNTTIFVSAGASGTNSIYNRSSTPANRLVRAVNALYGGAEGSMVAQTPATGRCSLTATTNVFGRVVNGVRKRNVCHEKSKNKKITGQFVHIEQQLEPRGNWTMWVQALTSAFPESTIPRR